MTRTLAPLLALALAGCASAGSAPSIPNATRERVPTYIDRGITGAQVTLLESWVEGNITSSRVAAAPEVVWSALLAEQAALELPVNLVDAGRRVTGVQEVRLRRIAGRRPSLFIDCGRGLNGEYANVYDVYLTLISEVIADPEEGGSQLRTRLEAQALDAAHGNAPIRCTSWRRLERSLAEAVRARIANS